MVNIAASKFVSYYKKRGFEMTIYTHIYQCSPFLPEALLTEAREELRGCHEYELLTLICQNRENYFFFKYGILLSDSYTL